MQLMPYRLGTASSLSAYIAVGNCICTDQIQFRAHWSTLLHWPAQFAVFYIGIPFCPVRASGNRDHSKSTAHSCKSSSSLLHRRLQSCDEIIKCRWHIAPHRHYTTQLALHLGSSQPQLSVHLLLEQSNCKTKEVDGTSWIDGNIVNEPLSINCQLWWQLGTQLVQRVLCCASTSDSFWHNPRWKLIRRDQ